METKTLFEITSDVLALNDELEALEGDLSNPETDARISAWMATIAEDQEKKLTSYGWLCRRLEMEAAAATEEAERFKAKATARTNRRAHLIKRLREHMDTIGAKKIETPEFTFAIQAHGGQRTVKLEPTLIPMAYKKAQWVVDGERVRQALEAGEEVPGAEILPRGSSLRIK